MRRGNTTTAATGPTASDWSDGWSPLNYQNLTIGFPVVVTINSADGDSGPSATAVTDLTIDTGAILDIVDGGLLTVGGILDVFGTLEVVDPGTPTLTLQGPVIVETTGTIEAIGPAATIYFQDTTPPPPGSYTVDNKGVIAADSGANVYFEQATTNNEAGAQIGSSNLGTVTFDQGSLDNSGTLGAGTIGFVVLNQTAVTNETTGLIATEDGGVLTFNQGSLDNRGTVTVNSGVMYFEQTTLTNELGAVMQSENGGVLIIDQGGGAISNIGTIAAQNGGTVQLENITVDNTGSIELNSTGSATTFEIGTVTLDDGGTVTLSNSSKNFIVSDTVNGLLTNVDNTISGAGTIGDTADTLFTLINEQGGTIDATGTTNALIIDNDSQESGNTFPANAVINTGTIEATGKAGLTIENSTIEQCHRRRTRYRNRQIGANLAD